MRHIYTSIDLGSDTVKALTCELYNGKLNLLTSSTVKSAGIRKGVIVDFDLALASVSKAIGELENDLGIRINKVIVNVPSYFSDFNVVRGKVSIEKVVTGADIVKVLQNGVKGNICFENIKIHLLGSIEQKDCKSQDFGNQQIDAPAEQTAQQRKNGAVKNGIEDREEKRRRFAPIGYELDRQFVISQHQNKKQQDGTRAQFPVKPFQRRIRRLRARANGRSSFGRHGCFGSRTVF